jgi:hypothetical protein
MIPVIINNRDIDCRKLIGQIMSMGGAKQVHMIDNGSTYPPLVEWMDSSKFEDDGIHIHRWPNTGPRAACKLVNELREVWTRSGVEFYATTDSDLDLSGVPSDLLTTCAHFLGTVGGLIKVGPALRLDDLPDTPQGRLAREAESKHWRDRANCSNELECWLADIDTTLAVYRLNPPWDGSYGPSVRLAGAYQARHLPWYNTDANRPPDHQWYLDHCDPQGTFYTAMEKAR